MHPPLQRKQVEDAPTTTRGDRQKMHPPLQRKQVEDAPTTTRGDRQKMHPPPQKRKQVDGTSTTTKDKTVRGHNHTTTEEMLEGTTTTTKEETVRWNTHYKAWPFRNCSTDLSIVSVDVIYCVMICLEIMHEVSRWNASFLTLIIQVLLESSTSQTACCRSS